MKRRRGGGGKKKGEKGEEMKKFKPAGGVYAGNL
jgi:hypothetical protein